MNLIGKGQFSTVYQKTKSTVLIKSKDNVKECMALGWFPNSKMFPKLERIGWSQDGEYQLYESKYYPRVQSLKSNLKPLEWEFYKTLRNLCVQKPEDFRNLPKKFRNRAQQLVAAWNALMNYDGMIGFEISPRNVAVNNGRLILLDCFYCFYFHQPVRENVRIY